MSQVWRIKEVDARASEALSSVHAACFPPGEQWTDTEMIELLAMPGCRAFLAACGDDAPKGLMIVRRAADEAEIITLGIAPDQRRRGIARALMRHVVDLSWGDGVRYIYLEVRAQNLGAQALYSEIGFKACGKRPRYYADGGDAIVMRLDLL